MSVPDSLMELNRMLCGCGDPVAVVEAVHAELKRSEAKEWKQGPETGAEWLLVYTLDHLGMTEHGSSVHCAWLTADGAESLAWLDGQPSAEAALESLGAAEIMRMNPGMTEAEARRCVNG